MLFLGHFSFSYESKIASKKAPEPWHGHFTAVAEAKDVSGAMRKFEALIEKAAASNELFQEIDEIHLDSCIEVASIPTGGFLGHVALEEGETVGSISTTLPGVPQKYAVSYHIEPETTDEDGSYTEEPFLVVNQKTAKKKAPKAAAKKKAAGKPKPGPKAPAKAAAKKSSGGGKK